MPYTTSHYRNRYLRQLYSPLVTRPQLRMIHLYHRNPAFLADNFPDLLLTPWCRVLLEKLTGLQLVKKFPAFHGTRRFITALTRVRHLSLSWASPIQSIYPHPTSRRSILILSTHLRLGLPSGLFPSGSPTKTLYTPLYSPIRATCPAHLILLDFITRTPRSLVTENMYAFHVTSICSIHSAEARRSSPKVQTGSGAHTASYSKVTEVLSRSKSTGA